MLDQDGHRIEHVRPPRDLQSWQQLPVSAVASFQPVVVEDLSRAALRGVLDKYPYQRFPVVRDGRLAGILTRKGAEVALTGALSLRLEPDVTCYREQTIQDLQQLLLDSTTQFVVVLDHKRGSVVGVVTLHDLLRSQLAAAERVAEAGNATGGL